jgi:hypothetical protein
MFGTFVRSFPSFKALLTLSMTRTSIFFYVSTVIVPMCGRSTARGLFRRPGRIAGSFRRRQVLRC